MYTSRKPQNNHQKFETKRECEDITTTNRKNEFIIKIHKRNTTHRTHRPHTRAAKGFAYCITLFVHVVACIDKHNPVFQRGKLTFKHLNLLWDEGGVAWCD